MSSPGIGRHRRVHLLLHEQAATRISPPDLCYVADFTHPIDRVTGLADSLVMLGVRYDLQRARNATMTALRTRCLAAYRTPNIRESVPLLKPQKDPGCGALQTRRRRLISTG